MKKRGFTLIELLAVIVVLAIIALIATPIVMNVIKNAQMGAAERSADNYLKAVEMLIATNKLDGNKVEDGSYTITSTGKLIIDGKEHEVEVSGTKPNGGTIKIENGQVVKNASSINIGDYSVSYKDGAAEAKEKGDALVLCTATSPVEQDIMNTEIWQMETKVVGTQATSAAPYAQGAVYKCDLGDGEKLFYVLKSTEDTVSLLMEENLDGNTAWCDQEGPNPYDVACAADGAIKHLNSKTSVWTKLFAENGMVRLPSYDDIAATGQAEWTWINIGVNYWTSTIYADDPEYISARAVGEINGDMNDCEVNDTNLGVRPVITISKENISL